MELLILFIIGLLIVIFILPFVALAKANTVKRGVDDLVTRLSSLENEVRGLRRQTVPVPKSEAVEAIPPPLPTTISAPVVEEKKSVPPPISQKIAEATVPQTARPAKPSMDWEQFMGAKLFAWIGGLALFLGVAFLLAVRLNAIVVAVLGIAGGFLTPVLLSTGQDHPLGLFMYIALLDIGLLGVGQRQRWNVLPILGAVGTSLMQFAWIATFFVSEKYFAGNKVLVVMAVFAGFQALFLAAAAWSKRTAKINRELLTCAIWLAAVAMCSAFYLLSFQTIAQRPTLLFSYLFVVDLGLLALTLIQSRLVIVDALAVLAAFIFLGTWTGNYLTTANLYVALAFYFVFALFHATAPLALQRLRKIEIPWWSHAFPALALLLVLMPIFQLSQLSIFVWPFVLIVDLLAIVLALTTATLLPILGVLLLTLVTMGAWLCRIPSELTGLPIALCLLGGFAIFFLLAASWASRRLVASVAVTRAPNLFGNIVDPVNLSVQLP